MKLNLRSLTVAGAAIAAIATPAVAQDANTPITTEEVEAAQKAWGEGIVKISATHTAGGDYKKAAKKHLEALRYWMQQKSEWDRVVRSGGIDAASPSEALIRLFLA